MAYLRTFDSQVLTSTVSSSNRTIQLGDRDIGGSDPAFDLRRGAIRVNDGLDAKDRSRKQRVKGISVCCISNVIDSKMK